MKCLILFVSLCFSCAVSGQENELVVIEHWRPAATMVNQNVIRGIVYDSLSNEALPVASIWVKGTKVGSITNEKGVFQLDVTSVLDTAKSFSLIINYICYARKELCFKNPSAMSGYMFVPMVNDNSCSTSCPGFDVSPKNPDKKSLKKSVRKS